MKAKHLIMAAVVVLAFASLLHAQSAFHTRIGPEGGWRATLAGAVLNDWIYTAEDNGGLYRTNPYTGDWSQVGGADFGNTRFMFALGGWLYTIEKDGSLYRVSAGNGSWQQIGETGAWLHTIAGTAYPFNAYDGVLLTAESNGGLYRTNPSNGTWQQVGNSEFHNTSFMFVTGGWLYTIESDGSLYQVHPSTGVWSRVGNAGDWRGTQAGAVLNKWLYTANQNGGLYVKDPAFGETRYLGAGFGNVRFMFAAAGSLYTIDTSGNLSRIVFATGSSGQSQETRPDDQGGKITYTHTSMNLTKLDGERFRADLEYRNEKGLLRTFTMEGTKAELRNWLETLPELSAKDRESMLRAVEMAGQVRSRRN